MITILGNKKAALAADDDRSYGFTTTSSSSRTCRIFTGTDILGETAPATPGQVAEHLIAYLNPLYVRANRFDPTRYVGPEYLVPRLPKPSVPVHEWLSPQQVPVP